MCNIKKFFTRAAGIPDPGYVSAADANKQAADKAAGLALTQVLQKSNDAANTALLAQQQATDQAKAASDSDSEAAQLAKEARLRKLASAGSFGATLKGDFAAPSVAYRQLFGGA